MKKQWKKPEIKDLNLRATKGEICYCEAGEIAAGNQENLSNSHHGGGYGGGHEWKPPHNGGNCPSTKPFVPAAPGFGPIGSVTPELDATLES